MDDDPHVHSLLSLALPRLGFRAWAASAEEALALLRQHGAEVALALLDVRMPGTDGPAALPALRALSPTLRFCFMTGGSGRYTYDALLKVGAEQLCP